MAQYRFPVSGIKLKDEVAGTTLDRIHHMVEV